MYNLLVTYKPLHAQTLGCTTRNNVKNQQVGNMQKFSLHNVLPKHGSSLKQRESITNKKDIHNNSQDTFKELNTRGCSFCLLSTSYDLGRCHKITNLCCHISSPSTPLSHGTSWPPLSYQIPSLVSPTPESPCSFPYVQKLLKSPKSNIPSI